MSGESAVSVRATAPKPPVHYPDPESAAQAEAQIHWRKPTPGLEVGSFLATMALASGDHRDEPGECSFDLGPCQPSLRAVGLEVPGAPHLVMLLAGVPDSMPRAVVSAGLLLHGQCLWGESVDLPELERAPFVVAQWRPSLELLNVSALAAVATLTFDLELGVMDGTLMVKARVIGHAGLAREHARAYEVALAYQGGRLAGLFVRTQLRVDTAQIYGMYQVLNPLDANLDAAVTEAFRNGFREHTHKPADPAPTLPLVAHSNDRGVYDAATHTN